MVESETEERLKQAQDYIRFLEMVEIFSGAQLPADLAEEKRKAEEYAAALLAQIDRDLEETTRGGDRIAALSAQIDATLADIRGSGR
jgi:hypothetical protein